MKRNLYHKHRRADFACGVGLPENDFISGAMSLSDQVRCFRAGGLPPATRSLSESVYDEDDVEVVDPSVNYGSDRFERSEAIAAQISERKKKAKEKRLKEARV